MRSLGTFIIVLSLSLRFPRRLRPLIINKINEVECGVPTAFEQVAIKEAC